MITIRFIIPILLSAGFLACKNPSSAPHSEMPEQEKQLRQQIAQHPDSLLLKENLIQYFRENGNYGQAIAETDQALGKDSASERLWYIKATLHSENDDTTHAIQAWERLIRISPDPEYLMSLGTLYAFSRNPLALGMADLLIAYGPASTYQGLFIKGLYYNSTGLKDQAAAFFKQCISIDYTNVLAYREKAIAEYDLGRYDDALQTLGMAIAVKKDYDEAYYWRGRCFEKKGDRTAAVNNYKVALQLSPDYVEAKDALAKMGVVL